MKRIVISGACGFLGRNIIQAAVTKGIPVLALPTFPERLDGIPVDIITIDQFLRGDVRLTDDDVFINCLFPTNADGYKMADGLRIVYKTIRTARESGVGAFINVSSQSVYASKRNSPAKETDNLCLETPYAVGKYCSEEYVNQVFGDQPHVNVRMSSLLGVGYDQRIVNRMVIQALKGESLSVIGGMQRYGFLDVCDAAAGLIKLAMSDPSAWKGIYNLGRNESYSLIDVVNTIATEMKRLAALDVTYTVSEGQDDRNSAVDASLFMHDIHWTPEITLSETTATIIRSKLGKAE